MLDAPAGPDTIRILIATDNHVGYNERDPVRGDDSAVTFDEIMCIAKEKTVDMILLAGDLFHENNPSRKALNSVMRSIRSNCYGDKPCELEMLSDPTEHFDATFDHVNYEDPNINVSIPIFSIHGNHDDPSGAGHLAALDVLQTAGLVNYYGRTPEADNITVKPVLLQKGRSKLALYGLSNVRDERLHRTFLDQQARFFRPNTHRDDWFNLCSVHQNHAQHTSRGTDYLPEGFLPDFLDLVVWGHEHECLIEPRTCVSQGFKIMQPGSSVATSLMPGEAVDKHVAIVEVTGKDFTCAPIRLKTVRPFVMREIVLKDDPEMEAVAMKEDNSTKIKSYLTTIIEEMIDEANQTWISLQADENEIDDKPPLPLIRLRVNYTPPVGGNYEVENTQRFSKLWMTRVANSSDIVQFHKKKQAGPANMKDKIDQPEEEHLEAASLNSIKVEKIVREFLKVQQLSSLPPTGFGEAVDQFVTKDDKYAMEAFINESVKEHMQSLMAGDAEDEDDANEQMAQLRVKMDDLFASGRVKVKRHTKIKPKPVTWDSDAQGHWEDQPYAAVVEESDESGGEEDEDEEGVPARGATSKRGRGGKAKAAPRKAATPKNAANKAKAAPKGRGKKKIVDSEDDVVIVADDGPEYDDEDEDVEYEAPLPLKARKTAARSTAAKPSTAKKASARSSAASKATKTTKAPTRQSQLAFSQPTTQTRQLNGRVAPITMELSDDEIEDDDDAFEPTPASTLRGRARR